MTTLGFIGTGTISCAFIGGLMATGKAPPILVSPRSEVASTQLQQRYANISRAGSNRDVATGSDIVFLGMRPAQVEEALSGITFRPGQILCSFVAGLSLADLGVIAPESTVCRVLPVPTVAVNRGPVIHVPAVPDIVELLQGMGDLVLPETEDQLIVMGGVSGLMSTFFELQETVVNWMVKGGVEDAAARIYLCSLFAALSDASLRSADGLRDLADEHETPGGLNQRTRRLLKEGNWFDQAIGAIKEVARISRSQLK